MTNMAIEENYPLSPMQQGMLFHHISAPENDVYLMQLVCKMHENVNVAALTIAWNSVINRHSIFRTRFKWQGVTEPVQSVQDHVSIPIQHEDWTKLSEKEQTVQLKKLLASDWKRGFDLRTPPLFRLTFIRSDVNEFIFIFTNHHTILDGRSRSLMLEEVFACYESLCKQETPKLSSPKDYHHYIDWLEKQEFSKSENFWRTYLEGFDAPTSIVDSIKSNDSELIANTYAEQFLKISEHMTLKLYEFAEQHEITLNTILQGVWSIILSRYSGQNDVIFGATRACRRSSLKGTDTIMGPLINTLPVRVCFPEGMSLLANLKKLRSQQITIRDFEQTPLVNIQQWSELAPGTSLFDSIIVFENIHLNDNLQSKGGNWLNRTFEVFGQTNYPITVEVYGGQQLLIKLAYDCSCFDGATITRMCGHLETLLTETLTTPEQQPFELELLTANERNQLLIDWNDTGTDIPTPLTIHELIEKQVEKTPNSIALTSDDQSLTYLELNQRSNRLAHYLNGLSMGPEAVVGICIERSPEMLIGILAILKSGGAYLPMDPKYPDDRLAFMLDDCQATILLTQASLKKQFSELKVSILCLDEFNWQDASYADANPEPITTPDKLAYIIYTSGSTGKPKGVAIEHKSTVALLDWAGNYFSKAELNGVLAATTFCFDLSVFEFFLPLTQGGRMILVKNVLQLSELSDSDGVTLVNSVPSAIAELVKIGDIPDSVQTVCLAGELLKTDLVDLIYQKTSATRVIDLYGPSEDTTYSTYRLRKQGEPPSIGRPIANTQAYILDQHLQPLPIGVSGELHLGGTGLARGYLNRPDLTTEKFINNPFSTSADDRLYKTGDLSRYNYDGSIEYLGRIDHQVKVRGFRIELGEIEALLNQFPSIDQSVVIVREDTPGDKQIIAYIVPIEEEALTLSELRGFLMEKLPNYMIPSAIVILDALPLTANGKVNRKALPSPKKINRDIEQSDQKPTDEVERKLVAIWEEVLGIDNIGIKENFFDLGGHSLLAVRLMGLIRERFNRDIHLNTLWFEGSTIEHLAHLIRETQHHKKPAYLVPIQPNGIKPPLFLIHTIGGGNLFHYDSLIRLLPPDQPIYGLLPQGLNDGNQPQQDIKSMAAHCIQIMQDFQPKGPYYLSGFSSAGVVAYEMAQQLLSQDKKVAMLALADTISPTQEVTIRHYRNLFKTLWQRKKYREIQERVYQYFLTRIGLTQLRQLKTMGESHRWALWNYVPSPYPGDVILFEASESTKQFGDCHLGWKDMVTESLQVIAIQGTHGLIVKEPGVNILAENLVQYLEKKQHQ